MANDPTPPANLIPKRTPSGLATWLIPMALRNEPSFRYAIAVAGLMVLVALGKVAFSSPYEALFCAAALLGLMFVYVVFNRLTTTGPKVLHAPALALTWGMVVLFFLCAVGIVSSALFDYPKRFPVLIADIQGKSTTEETAKPSQAIAPLNRDSVVPVTIKAVYDSNFRPASRTILTVKTADGKVVNGEVIPDDHGIASITLPPNRYVLSATGSAQAVPFEVLPPKTEVAIGISRSVVAEDAIPSETITLDAGTSADAMKQNLFVSLVAIDFGGQPLRHRVTFSVGGRGISSKTYDLADVGTMCIAGPYLLRVATADTFKASFVITKR